MKSWEKWSIFRFKLTVGKIINIVKDLSFTATQVNFKLENNIKLYFDKIYISTALLLFYDNVVKIISTYLLYHVLYHVCLGYSIFWLYNVCDMTIQKENKKNHISLKILMSLESTPVTASHGGGNITSLITKGTSSDVSYSFVYQSVSSFEILT